MASILDAGQQKGGDMLAMGSLCRARPGIPWSFVAVAFCLGVVAPGVCGGSSPKFHVSGAGETYSIVFECDEPTFRATQIPGCDGVTVEVEGLTPRGEAGRPWLPAYGAFLRMPDVGDATLEVRLVAEETKTIRGVDVTPWIDWAVSPESTPTAERDESVYSTDAFYPLETASVSWEGIMRTSRVARVSINPIRYNPLRRELLVTTRLEIEVTVVPGRPSGTDAGAPAIHTARVPSVAERDPVWEEVIYPSILANVPPVPRSERNELHAPPPAGTSRSGVDPEDADYLMIVHDSLMCTAIDSLRLWRESQGLKVSVVETSDLGPTLSDSTIKDCIETAFWEGDRMLSYVFLIGDADDDGGADDLLPTHYEQGIVMCADTVAYDAWYSWVAGDDDLPDLFVGRLPALDSTAVSSYVDKLLEYERQPGLADWCDDILLAVQDYGVGDFGPRFNLHYESVRQMVPDSWEQFALLRSDFPSWRAFRDSVIATINNPGVSIAHSIQPMSPTSFLPEALGADSTGIGRLSNGQTAPRYPFFLLTGCHGCEFDSPTTPRSIADTLVTCASDRGGIACFGPSRHGASVHSNQLCAEEYLSGLFTDGETKTGPLCLLASLGARARKPSSKDLYNCYTLLGDPALKLCVNTGPPPSEGDESLGTAFTGAGCDVADIDGNGCLDLFLLGVRDIGESHHVIWQAARDVEPDGSSDSWTELITTPAWISGHAYGAGAAIGDLDQNGQPDLVVMLVANDDGGPWGHCRYRVGSNLHFTAGGDSCVVDSWSETGTPGNLHLACDTEGGGVALGDIDGDGWLDLVVMEIQHCTEDDWRFEYVVGDRLYPNGSVDGWSPERERYFELDEAVDGGGVELVDMDQDGNLELVLMAIRDPGLSDTSYFKYLVGDSLQLDGTVSRWSRREERSTGAKKHFGAGLGSGDLDRDGGTDLVLLSLEDYDTPTPDIFRYQVVGDLHRRFRGSGFEASDPWPVQGTVLAAAGAESLITRVVVSESLDAHEGSRMLHFAGRDTTTIGNCCASMLIFDKDVEVRPPLHLSFWAFVDTSPCSLGAVTVDGRTDVVTSLADWPDSVRDQYGVRLHPRYHSIPPQSWRRYVYDLSPVDGHRLTALTVAYDDHENQENGEFSAYFDQVRLMSPPASLDSSQCSVDAQVGKLLCPAGDGDAVIVTVTVRDSGGVAIPGIEADDIYVVFWPDHPETVHACNGWTATADSSTSESGTTTVTVTQLGGCDTAEIVAFVGGVECGRVEVMWRSPDLNGDGTVGMLDLAIFAAIRGTENWCGDFDGSGGEVGLLDLAVWLAHRDHDCSGTD